MKIAGMQSYLSWISMLCLCIETSSHSLRKASQVVIESSFRSDQVARKQVLADDQEFWGEMATGTTSELYRLAEAVGSSHQKSSKFVSMLDSHRAVASPSDDVSAVAELAILDGAYEESKKRVVQLNQHESISKQRYLGHQKEDQERVAALDAEFKVSNGQHMSAALQANNTALKAHLEDEETFFRKYWERVRSRNHKQFHTCLKIQHGLMDRLKTMREAYRQAETQQAVAVQPEVAAAALIQHQSFVHEALGEVAALHKESASWD